MDYARWAARLLETYFAPGSAGERVWLSTSPHELDEIGPDLGGDAGLQEAVLAGPQWPTVLVGGRYGALAGRGDLLATGKALMRQWQQVGSRPPGYSNPGALAAAYSGIDAPPFLPHLAFLARAGLEPGEDTSYYARLSRLTGVEWSTPEMIELHPLWEALERWCEVVEFRFGCFDASALGPYRYVGVPRAQVLLDFADILRLHRFFGEHGLTPGVRGGRAQLRQLLDGLGPQLPFSAPLVSALTDRRNRELQEVARQRVIALFDEWDGTRPGPRTPAAGGNAGQHAAVGLGFCLSLSSENRLPWRVLLKIPAIRDDGVLVGAVRENRFSFNMGPRESVVAAGNAATLLESLGVEGREEIELKDTQGWSIHAEVAGRRLRVFSPRQEVVAGEAAQFLECELPAHGAAYVLIPEENRPNFEHWARLCANHATIQECPTQGLPNGWSLSLVGNLEAIPQQLRDLFPDGLDCHPQPRPIRLVGGTRVQRMGHRWFLPYDLPLVELDAPPGAILEAAGVAFGEMRGGGANLVGTPFPVMGGVRQYSIVAEGAVPSRVEIRAMLHGRQLDSVAVRIAQVDGLPPPGPSPVGVGRFGAPMRTGERVSGATVLEVVQGEATPCLAGRRQRGAPVDWEAFLRKPAISFGDALAHRVRMPYGEARDLASRLLKGESGLVSADIGIGVARLCARGLVEMEVDHKGRWATLNAPKPTAYLLPPDESGRTFAGLAGALTRQHWSDLRTRSEYGLRVESYGPGRSPLTPNEVVISADSERALRQLLLGSGVAMVQSPVAQVVRIAGDIRSFRDALAGVLQGPSEGTRVEVYRAAQGGGYQHGVPWSRYFELELFRSEDPETRRHLTYAVRYQDGANHRYAHIRDQHWGRWLAILGAYRFLAPEIGLDAGAKWPLAYESRDSTLWIPVKLGFPGILERALVLCSGRSPLVRHLVRTTARVARGDFIAAADADTGLPVAQVPAVYDAFVPAVPGPAGDWLCFWSVPEGIAQMVAGALEGTLVSADIGGI